MRQLIPEKHASAILVILTLFAVVGPVSIDIFTPSLPAITRYFATDNATAQWSVGIFMLGFSVSMLICGPLADRLGRKKTLMLGYSLYLLATLITLNTTSIHAFIAARFAQAIFGCFGTAIARTLARDYYRDQMEIRMLAMISGSLTIAPMLAPIAGGLIQEYAGWQYSFAVMAMLAVLAMLALQLLPERYQATAADSSGLLSGVLSGYTKVLTDWRYLRFTFAAGVAFSGAFVFVAGAPFVLIGTLGVTPKHYGLIFALAIGAYMASAACAPWLNRRLSRTGCLKVSGSLLALGALVSLVLSYINSGQAIFGYVTGIVIYELGLGVYLPICQARATEHMKDHIGTASGLIFFIEMLLATMISSLTAWLPQAGTTPLALVTLTVAGLSLLCLLAGNSKKQHSPQST